MIKKVIFVNILCALFIVGANADPIAGGLLDPVSLLKSRTESVQLIIKKLTETSAPEEIRKTQDELKEEINKLLDFQELADRALGQHKEKLTETQVSEFSSLLRELIERAYTNRIKSSKDFTFKITKKEIKDDDAFVEMLAFAGEKSAKTAYRLHKKEGKWVAYDFIIEDVSLVNQYKTQFNKIISEKGFDVLMEKMKKKLAELENDVQNAKSEESLKSE